MNQKKNVKRMNEKLNIKMIQKQINDSYHQGITRNPFKNKRDTCSSHHNV